MEVFSFPLGFWIKCIVIVERQTVGVLLCFLASIMKEGFVGVNAQARSGWKQGAFFPRPPDVLEVDLDIRGLASLMLPACPPNYTIATGREALP